MAAYMTYLVIIAMIGGACIGGPAADVASELKDLQNKRAELKGRIFKLKELLLDFVERLDEEYPVNHTQSSENEGNNNVEGSPGVQGISDSAGLPMASTVFTRWGKRVCGTDSELIYEGFVGKSGYSQTGGGINYQCMYHTAEHIKDGASSIPDGFMTGVTYQTTKSEIFPENIAKEAAPCAVCYTNNRSASVTIPGQMQCPNEWIKEYDGYLMSSQHSENNPSFYACVDSDPDVIDEYMTSDIGGRFYFNRPLTNMGMPKSSYDSGKVITCVVCTK